MKVTLFGSNGMAGHVITRYLKSKGHTVFTVARANADYILDIENCRAVDDFLTGMDCGNFIVNCIGLLVKDSIARPDRAAWINGWFPHFLEYKKQNSHTRIIHLSTDCVFDGKTGNYTEKSIHSETNAYGKSKSFGEINNDKDITFRMSIIGPELKNGTGLFNWIVKNPDTILTGWSNAWWNGITTLELARCIELYISTLNFTGVYHLVNNQNFTDKYSLLHEINDVFELNKTIIEAHAPKDVSKILVDTRKLINFNIPNYHTQLEELKAFMNT